MKYLAERSGFYSEPVAVTLNLISQSLDFLACKTGHDRDARNIRRPSAETIIRTRNVNECSFGNFGEFSKADTEPQKYAGDGPHYNEERAENSSLDFVLHSEPIYWLFECSTEQSSSSGK